MSKQVTVRLPDMLVEFIDEQVEHGDAASRAAVIARAIRREQRRAIAARDAAILARTGTPGDLERLAGHAAETPLDID
jgi:antitoxin MazE3